KNRFIRNHGHRVETYSAALHRADCLRLLESWKDHQDTQHDAEPNASAIKRAKESIATKLCLDTVETLGLKGMVVYVRADSEGSGFRVQISENQHLAPVSSRNPEPRSLNPAIVPRTLDLSWQLKGFTFGEPLGPTQSSITIEKTDLTTKGLAQFIFSEFCRL